MPATAPTDDARVRYSRREGLSVTREEDDYFLVDPTTEAIFHLNTLGRAMWDLLAAPQVEAELVAAIADAFPEVPIATVAGDVAGFLRNLGDAGLVDRVA